MEKQLKYPVIGLLSAWIVLSSCVFDSSSMKASGTGEETTNGISGLVTQGDEPAAGVPVSLFSRNYQPLESDRYWQVRMDTITDRHGYYRFRDLAKGEYNVVANQTGQGLSAILQNINVLTDTSQVAAPSAVLGATGSLALSLNEINPKEGSYIFVPGTNFYTKITKTNVDQGLVGFTGLPAGEYGNFLYLDKPGSASFNLLASKISVLSGITLIPGPYAAWSHSAEIHINTSSTGANIKSNLLGFPLLVRLTAANFSFATADAKGNDLRVVKPNNTPLPFEIEHWDSAGQSAVIWVGMDTLKGNNADQSIRLYWGNARAQSKSNGPDVFTQKNGFSGVWHLADNRQDFIITESSGQYSGISRKYRTEIESQKISSTGMIGRGFNFTDREWIDLGQARDYLNAQPVATLSGWCKPVFDSTKAHSTLDVISIGVGQEDSSISTRAGVEISSGSKFRARGRALDLSTNSQTLVLANNVSSNTWYYFTAIINYAQNSISFYVDGVLKSVDYADFGAGLTENTNSMNSSIGSQDNGTSEFFSGQLDEMRVTKGANSPDWIKMCYENQKPGSMVVSVDKIFGP